jgi:hypothetical protein
MPELIVHIKGGKIQNRQHAAEAFNKLADGQYRLILEPHRVRSLDQNAYYWGVVVPLVQRGLYATGDSSIKTELDAHNAMKEQFLAQHIVESETLTLLEKRKLTTTTLNTMQFNAYLEGIKQWAAEYLNLVIPDPIPGQFI